MLALFFASQLSRFRYHSHGALHNQNLMSYRDSLNSKKAITKMRSSSFRARLATNPTDVEGEKYLLRAYIETGRYAEAEAAGQKVPVQKTGGGRVRHELAEVFAVTGRYAEAISEFERAGTDAAKSPAGKTGE